MVVCIFVGLVVISLLLFLLYLFDSSFFVFLLIWLAIYFVDLFKKPAPGFIEFLNFFLSISFISALILVISCFLLAFEFFFLILLL